MNSAAAVFMYLSFSMQWPWVALAMSVLAFFAGRWSRG